MLKVKTKKSLETNKISLKPKDKKKPDKRLVMTQLRKKEKKILQEKKLVDKKLFHNVKKESKYKIKRKSNFKKP